MKRCLCCGFECESHLSTCPMCGEGSWCDLGGPAPQLEPVTLPDASPKPVKRGRK